MPRKMNKLMATLVCQIVIVMLVGGLLVCSAVTGLHKQTWGWFSQNRQVAGNGMAVGANARNAELKIAYGEYNATDKVWEYREWKELTDAPLELNLPIPGARIRFKVQIRNASTSEPISVRELGFSAFLPAEEVAKTVSGANYYLGTQLTAGVVDSPAVALASYVSGSSGTLQTAADLPVFSGSREIAPSGTTEFEIEVCFFNADSDQGVYAAFGDGSECCKRRLYFLFD